MAERVLPITLLTDYSYQAGFVGALHAVAAQLAPGVPVIDLDHSIPPGDVRLGALRLERLSPYLPIGVHVGVVDPGVGGTRRPVALRAGEHVLVGPDNGLLVFAADRLGGIAEAVQLDNDAVLLERRARTFDGRDVFVPAACAILAGGLSVAGTSIDARTLVRLERPTATRLAGRALQVEVLQIDGFGNVQLSADAADVADCGLRRGEPLVLESPRARVEATFADTFSDVPPGDGVVLLDSDGQLAFSINRGRADEALFARPGEHLRIAPAG